MLRADVWPLERTFTQTSVSDLLERLGKVTYKGEPGACNSCRIYVSEVVKGAVRATGEYFDGLCLLCMTKTFDADDKGNPKRSADAYWTQHREKSWGLYCRRRGFEHGEPTWYFSYMGSKPHKDAREAWYDDNRFNDYYF